MKRHIALMSLLCMAFYAKAQLTLEWSQVYGGDGNDYGQSVVLANDGHVVIGGFGSSYGDGQWDGAIYKLDNSTGNELWSTSNWENGWDRCLNIVCKNDGGFAVGGDRNAVGDFYLAFFTAEGSFANSYTYNNGGYDHCYSIIEIDESRFSLAGKCDVTYWDFCLMEAGSDGQFHWMQHYNSRSESVHKHIQLGDGGFLIFGHTEPVVDSWDMWLVRTDSLGNFLWAEAYGGEGNEYGRDVISTNDGDYILVGRTNSVGNGNYDAYILKVDQNGNVIWEETFGGTENEEYIAVTCMGEYIIAVGYTESFGAGGKDGVISIYSYSGNLLESLYAGGQYDDQYNSIITDIDNIYIGGERENDQDNNMDIWLEKYSVVYDHYESVTWNNSIIDNDIFGIRDIQAADVDGDGDPDLIVAAAVDDSIYWYENDSDVFLKYSISYSINNVLSVCVADVNYDNDYDIVSASYEDNNILYFENINSLGSYNISYEVNNFDSEYSFDAIVFDVDSDSDMDIVAAGYNTIKWIENTGNNTYTISHDIINGFEGGQNIYMNDQDSDGDMDILRVGERWDELSWFENDGSGQFLIHNLQSLTGATNVKGTDLDGDGDQDIVACGGRGHCINWYENDGNQNFQTHTVIDGFLNAYNSIIVDIDNDGDLDIAGVSENGNKVSWFENDGNQNFQERDVASLDRPFALCPIDYDQDGDMDLVSAEYYQGTLQLYENTMNPDVNTIHCTIPQNQWTLIGIPVEVTDGSWSTLFGDDVSGSAGVTWRLSQWDAANNTYIRYGEADHPTDLGQNPPAFAPGLGYWFYQTEAAMLTLDITPAQINRAVSEGAPCQLSMNQGANAATQVANPFNYTSDWRRMRIYDDANDQRWSIFAAAQNGSMNSYAYIYNGSSGEWENVQCYGTNNVTLDAWEGFFVKQTDGDNSFQLEMMPANLLSGEPEGADFELDEPGGFMLPLELRMINGPRRDTQNRIGVHSSANDGYDWLDAFEFTPRTPEFAQLYFDHSTRDEMPDVYSYDYRSADFSGGSKTWYFTVRTWQLPGEELELTWPGIEMVDDAYELLLYTPDNTEIDLRTTDSFTFTSNNEADSRQNFMIVCRCSGNEIAESSTLPVKFGIHDLYPNPFNDQVRISYGLPEAGDVRLTVFNILGQQVARIAEGNRTAGLHHTQWHAKNMASGVYIVKLEAAGQSVVRKVQLVR